MVPGFSVGPGRCARSEGGRRISELGLVADVLAIAAFEKMRAAKARHVSRSQLLLQLQKWDRS
jgi:hypothetical protein